MIAAYACAPAMRDSRNSLNGVQQGCSMRVQEATSIRTSNVLRWEKRVFHQNDCCQRLGHNTHMKNSPARLQKLLALLVKANTEEDVKAAWAKTLGIDYNTSDDHDLYTPQVLFEFKFDRQLT